MASFFDFLFDCLPMAIAHHGAHYATKEDRRTTIREGLRRANLGEIRQQMMRLTTVRPSVLQGPGIDPERLKPRLWKLGIGNDLASVGRGTCISTGQGGDEMVVFERIQWGREVGGSVAPFVEVETLTNTLELPLTHDFLLDEWLVVASAHVGATAIDMFPLETRPDFGLVRVFMYELDTDTMEVVPLDPDAFDVRDAEGFDRYKRAAALLDSSIPGGGDVDALIGEDLCAFEPFYSFEELEAIGGSIGVDEMVRFAVQRPRFLVATSIQLCKQNEDLEPGAILGAAKFHPNILVTSSTTLLRVDAATRIERPLKTVNLSRPGHCGCDQMHEEIRPLLVTDTNKAEMLYPAGMPPVPYWGNLFSYYLVDPHLTNPGREWEMIRPEEGDRAARGYVDRSAPAPIVELTSDLTSKVPGQGDFDNIHIAPRMHLRDATHVSVETLVFQPPLLPRRVRSWREIRATDLLHLDPIVMAPFCAHDCLHFHVRWGDHATAAHVRGWARDPLLMGEVKRTGRNKLSKELMERCRARVALPNAEPGSSMYPPWHEVKMQVDINSALLSISTVVPTLPGQREILFHSPWAYGVEFERYLAFAVGSTLVAGRTGQDRFELGKKSSSGAIETIDPYDESAVFYWILRYKSIVRSDGSYEAREYHFARDLEKAISL